MKNKINKKIDNLEKYIEENYKGAYLKKQKELELPMFLQKEFTITNNDCTLVAITRILKYYFSQMNVDKSYEEIYNIALNNLFMKNVGTFPNKIDNIVKDYFKLHKINGTCYGKYICNFYTHIKKEIDQKRPVIMNVGFGYYKNHTITISGYSIYKFKNMNIKILNIVDSWNKSVMYLDYSELTAGLYSLPIFSLNTIKIK